MNRTRSLQLAIPAVLAALVLAATGAASRTAGGATTAAADQVREAERTLLRAQVDADTATAAPLLAADLEQINVLGANGTREDYLATTGGAVDFVALEPVSPIRVRVYGNAAVARFRAWFEVVAGPDRVEHYGWFTNLFEKRAGRWQLVWSQTTATPNNPALLIQALKPRS
jgi:hypothetical protein